MKILLLLASGAAAYAVVRDGIPKLFIARMMYVYRLETTKASIPKD
ncbi:hypothetical protein SEA_PAULODIABOLI_198 [Microbacterium phage PauloDiaboli]|nr:hypothetical protein SEA_PAULODIABOLI_198 [Microbacterium phage PauloDiaboli]QWY84006.1 hypothetical protein SEA_A3WALLY_199 [Microbacterium phage A3Wally]